MCLKCTGLELNPLCSESASSPSTEEDAIQGMLSMAGLLYSHPSEDPSSSQESWWSRTNHPSPDYSRSSWEFLKLISVFSDKILFWWTIACVLLPFSGRKEVASREENQDSDSSSSQVNPILICTGKIAFFIDFKFKIILIFAFIPMASVWVKSFFIIIFRRAFGSMIQKENLTPNSSIGSRNTRTSWTARAVAATAAVRRGAVTHTPQPMRKAPFWATNTVKHPYRHLCTRPRDLPQIPHQSAIRPPKVQHHHFIIK